MEENRCALVTGSTRGIGRGIAKELAKEGINIGLNGRHKGKDSQEAVKICKEEGVDAHFFQGDIANSKARTRIVNSLKELFGRLDILVNNAGVAPNQRKDILEASEESFDRVININLKGPYFLTQLVANWMIEQKNRRPKNYFYIINISSLSAYASSPARGEYCISKAGISMATKLYSHRLAEEGINVYEIRPGIIYTSMTKPVKEKYDKLISKGITPIKRWGEPEDVGKAVVGIVKGFYNFSTGEVINVDGGFHLQRL